MGDCALGLAIKRLHLRYKTPFAPALATIFQRKSKQTQPNTVGRLLISCVNFLLRTNFYSKGFASSLRLLPRALPSGGEPWLAFAAGLLRLCGSSELAAFFNRTPLPP